MRPRLAKKFSVQELNAHKDTLITAWPGEFNPITYESPVNQEVKISHVLEKEKAELYPVSDQVFGPNLSDFMLMEMNSAPKPKPWMIKKD